MRTGPVFQAAGDISDGDAIAWQDPGDHFGCVRPVIPSSVSKR